MRTKLGTVGEWAPRSFDREGRRDRRGAELAHELKNPLAAMKALVQLGLRNPVESPSHERLALLEREVARMQELLVSHLGSARAAAEGAPEPVQLGPLVSGALRALAARAVVARVALSAKGDAWVNGDPRRLEEALVNLIVNGIEATPAGGAVRVEVRPAGGRVEIRVSDTGRGMARETLRRLGTPYFTTREGGTGLGVALARAVIEQHGGSLRYRSEPGEGTTVEATLPGAGAPGRPSRSEAYRPPGRTTPLR